MDNPNWQQQLIQPALYRILDANLDRVREGLRIIEEWCRFGLNHPEFTEECKSLRQELASWHRAEFRSARDTLGDVGTHITHEREAQRDDIKAVLQANFCRIQEALRVLEEYGKVQDPAMGEACKQMRYRVYSLESELLAHDRHQKLQAATLYLVTSPANNIFNAVEAALQGGLQLVQYRDKDSEDTLRLQTAAKLAALCHDYGALFLINDRVDIALAVNADGVHLGQQDIPIGLARQILGPNRIIGRSTTNPEELARAIQEGADYIGVGPVHETPTKPGKSAAGLDYVRYAAEHSPLPWFAIGGINPDNVNAVVEAGARRVAVVRSLMQSEQPTLTTQYFLAQLNRPSRPGRDRQTALPPNALPLNAGSIPANS
ncbi:MAG: thiamine phosphate synthase [Synechococcales cyanobacterium RM1_1_8]|nr:thiamine phosphate synthase [Synechococcales cyanobacterium RM1_1_8]